MEHGRRNSLNSHILKIESRKPLFEEKMCGGPPNRDNKPASTDTLSTNRDFGNTKRADEKKFLCLWGTYFFLMFETREAFSHADWTDS